MHAVRLRSPVVWISALLLFLGIAAPLLATDAPLLRRVPGEGWSAPAFCGRSDARGGVDGEGDGKIREGGGFVLRAPVPYSPAKQVRTEAFQAPSKHHWMGTDHLGRDVASRLVHGTRVSLGIGLLATAMALAFGLLVGGLAGYAGGWADLLLSRLIEIFASFPALVLALTFVAFFPPGVLSLAAIIAIVGWTGIARHARAEALRVRGEPFVDAARASGAGRLRILIRQVLPQTLYAVVVPAAYLLARAILVEAALSMIGLGVSEPTASWGNVLALSRSYLHQGWWFALFPGLFLFVTLTLCNRWGEILAGAEGGRWSLKASVRP